MENEHKTFSTRKDASSTSIPRGIVHFPRWFWYSVLSFVLLVSMVHFLSFISRILRRSSSQKSLNVPCSEADTMDDNLSSATKRNHQSTLQHFSYAVLSCIRNAAFRRTIHIPIAGRFNTSEIVLTAVYLFLTVLWAHLQVEAQHPSSFYKFSLIWSDRTGIIASSQIPLMIALAGKNNIISLLTGISYEKLNVLHQATSHVMFLMVYIHSLAWVGVWLLRIRPINWSIFWLWTGVVATISHTLITILGLKVIRKLSYEFFLITHIILAFVFLLFTYFHVSYHIFGLGFTVWPAMLLWASDHIIRSIRIIALVMIRRAESYPDLDATIKVLPGETLLVQATIPPSRHLSWIAGQSAYITAPCVSKIPEAHPFTIASIDSVFKKTLDRTEDDGVHEEEDNENQAMLRGSKSIKFIIRACGGFTRRLYDFAVRKTLEGGSCTVPMYIDSPYSHPPHVEEYDSVILISGGSGVAFTLPLLLSIARSAIEQRANCKRVVFVWTIKHYDHISWISSDLEELSSDKPDIEIEVKIFVTQPYSLIPITSGTEDIEAPRITFVDSVTNDGEELEAKLQSKWPTLPTSIQTGRPDFTEVLLDEIGSSHVNNISVVVCGPSALAESVREGLRKPELTGFRTVLDGAPLVDLHIESFSW